MEQPEEHRNKWALGLATTLSLIILISFTFYRGYLSFGNQETVVTQKSTNQVASVVSAPSPIENSKQTFKATFDEIGKQYQDFKDSVSNVLVPFIEGIDVYERK